MPAPKHIPILRARIEQGRVMWFGIDGKKWDAAKKHLEGAEVEITIRKRPKRRSLNQNNFYWGCVIPIVAEAGAFMTDDEAHDAMRFQFLKKHAGELVTVGSTTELTTVEFEEYLNKIRILAADMWGAYVPEPWEVTE